MSRGSQQSGVASCRPTDVESVTVPAAALESTTPTYLHDLRGELDETGRRVAEVTVGSRTGASTATPALRAVREHGHREGITLAVDGIE